MPVVSDDEDFIFRPVILSCGRVIQNRLVKAPLYEHLGPFLGGPPTPFHLRLYSEWAKYDWGMVVTGNFQIAGDHLGLGRDVVIPAVLSDKDELLLPFKRLADAMHGIFPEFNDNLKQNNTLAIVQLSHCGRQSSNILGGRWPFHRPLAPSPIRLGASPGHEVGILEDLINRATFQTPKEMTKEDILHVVDRFVDSAVFLQKAGFDGIQLHVAHGYLLSQFLSPRVNKRTDEYSYDKALDLLHAIISRIRTSTSKDFVVCIKLNAADYTNSTDDATILTDLEQRAMQHVLTIASWGMVDVIEISGGDYETPIFVSTSEDSAPMKPRSRRQAFFSRFSRHAVQALSASSTPASRRPLVMLTGGLRSPALLTTALASKHADLLGIGRAAVVSPDIPSILKSHSPDNRDIPFNNEPILSDSGIFSYPPLSWIGYRLTQIRLVGATANIAWYTMHMRKIATLPMIDGEVTTPPDPDYSLGGLESVLRKMIWTGHSSGISDWGLVRPFFISIIFLGLVTYLLPSFHIP